MKRILLIGENISRSLSPAMHNGALDYLGLSGEYRYELMPVAPRNFDAEIKKILTSADVLGFNVTAPYKCEIIRYLDETEQFVQKCGACNYVKKENGRWHGKNTDGYGFIMPLAKMGLGTESKKVTIMGAGGAARAVVLQLINNGAASITIINRSPEKAAVLKSHICAASGFDPEKFIIYSYLELQKDKFSSIMIASDIIVNATSAGSGENRLPVLFNAEMFNKNQIIYDLSYVDKAGDDLKDSAKKASAVYIDGKEMLMYQGLVSFVQWTSKKPPTWLLRKIVGEQLDKVKS
ncbi:MAG: hypothetical protein ACD_47C00319G0002 [uncultured bacterium]|uniref:Shikimate dehydrogenase (NADP(+)) n=1 Tax=Candidatus Wallbacteria bacterium GWC2_49_35 TaxID=1817813 RepID=A0A1F7WNY7_9BACT|nr:MAG: hypothetical protein ACD_47C00319G0002 [uncultured bacterium]OGM04552.1 MAG: hypothetical protein A2008_06055 [Candidatus Wallbacteria bacterium GWC2_49_35]HBC76189.1 hypothetical protein [Candidatus Wallbacteria bacterium]